MAQAITATIISEKLTPSVYASYITPFLKAVKDFDYAMYEKFGDKRTLPANQYGDTVATGDTGGDAARAAGLYEGFLDGFKITAYDDLAYIMNYGFRLDDMGSGAAPYVPTDLYDGIKYNFTDFEIPEGKGYGNTGTGAVNYRAHDKGLTNKFYINVPIVRFGATTQYDSVTGMLIGKEDNVQLMKAFGQMAQMVQTQYVRATLINEATQLTPVDLTATGTVADIKDSLVAVKRQLKKRKGEKFTSSIAATDKVGTESVRASYIAIISSQMEDTIDQIEGFIHVDDYSNSRGLMPNEYGTVKKTEIRFITNDVLVRQSEEVGGRVLGIADVMTDAELSVYNILIMAKDAYTIASLQGANRYQIFIDLPGQGNDTLRLEKNCGWKVHLGVKVHRPAWIYNLQVKIAA